MIYEITKASSNTINVDVHNTPMAQAAVLSIVAEVIKDARFVNIYTTNGSNDDVSIMIHIYTEKEYNMVFDALSENFESRANVFASLHS